MEICVQPLRLGRRDIVDQYTRYICQNSSLIYHPSIDMTVAKKGLDLQVRYALRIPDALQIALAAKHSATVILTNDKQWKRISEAPVLLVEELSSRADFNT